MSYGYIIISEYKSDIAWKEKSPVVSIPQKLPNGDAAPRSTEPATNVAEGLEPIKA